MLVFVIFSVMVGAALGSFCCCQAWRIYYKNKKHKDLGKRSVCLSCGRKLKWSENIPIFSWILQKGKCRRCGAKIGSAELISEILGGIFGGVLGVKFLDNFIKAVFKDWRLWEEMPVSLETWILGFGALLIVVIFTIMGIIAIYDAKWGEMPVKLLWVAVGLSVIFAGVRICNNSLVEREYDCCPSGAQCIVGVCIGKGLDFELVKKDLLELGGSIVLLAGIYYILYKVSREKWVGGGDWILCLAIALVLGKPFLALLELSLSNVLGLAVMLPVNARKKGKTRREIPFGPFLVVACMVIFCLEGVLGSLGV